MKREVKWKAGLYIRLSREDEQCGESNSITSQREILREYLKQHSDIEEYDCYIDDGWTGTNFERPGFKRMLDDIHNGLINCVIVKDLSRFGRNYTMGGELITNEFVRLNIRFVACNNYYDSISMQTSAATNCITLGVTNVINESVSATTSVNVRATLNVNRKQGKFIGSFASYGYKKDPNDKHKLIVDDEAADIVKMIYKLFLEGNSILWITRKLNEMGIPNPTMYKYLKGVKYKNPSLVSNDGLWQDSTVRRILKNEIYTGTMVQGKSRNVSYKDQRPKKVAKEEWFVVEGTHEAIIDKNSFDTIQDIFAKNIHSMRTDNKVFLFAGLVKCASCGRAMVRKVNNMPYGKYEYYRCVTNKKMKKDNCPSCSIRIDKLEKAVLLYIQHMVDAAVNYDEMIQKLNSGGKNENIEKMLEANIKELRDENNKYLTAVSGLYTDLKNGIITKNEYFFIKEDLAKKISVTEKKLLTAEQKRDEYKSKNIKNEFVEYFKKYGNISSLTRGMLLELIDSIEVYSQNKIEINVKYKKEYEDICKYCSA